MFDGTLVTVAEQTVYLKMIYVLHRDIKYS